jgi:murein DD-endopeptidase MepM/ murein hydrolase activator NlpD
MTVYQYPFREPFRKGTAFGKKGNLWKCGYHSGLDLLSRAAGGDGKVYPIACGRVTACAKNHPSYGNYVTLLHGDGMLSLYAHLERILVKSGQQIDAETALGIEGETGNATGIHLHLELHERTYRYPSEIDPAAWLDARLAQQEEEQDNRADGYAAEAVLWARETGLLRGDETGAIHLHEPISRQDTVVLLHRLKAQIEQESRGDISSVF